VFDQLRRTSDGPGGRLAANWPPPSRRGDVVPANGGYSADRHGDGYEDVVLELQLPERIVCRTCAEATGQSFANADRRKTARW